MIENEVHGSRISVYLHEMENLYNSRVMHDAWISKFSLRSNFLHRNKNMNSTSTLYQGCWNEYSIMGETNFERWQTYKLPVPTIWSHILWKSNCIHPLYLYFLVQYRFSQVTNRFLWNEGRRILEKVQFDSVSKCKGKKPCYN